MHKLLKRQMNRYLDGELNDEKYRAFIEAVSIAYDQFDEDHALTERSLELVSEEFIERNESLVRALKELKETQSQLIKSEKMAVLGQLVAGIAHELNTPVAAILSVLSTLNDHFFVIIKDLLHLMINLNEQEQHEFLNICMTLLKSADIRSSSTIRENRKAIQAALIEKNIPSASSLAHKLAAVGFNAGGIALVLSVAGKEQMVTLVESIYQVGFTKILLSDAKKASHRIANLVKALKLYSHTDQNALVETNIVTDIETTLTILHNKLKRAIIVNKKFDVVPTVICYADELNQVWTNLINNAIDAMKGKGVLTIRIKPQGDNAIKLEFEDTGPGIKSEHLKEIFDPFFTTKSKGKGTGLGLSICAGILEKHRATIKVVSTPGKTVFQIILPLITTEVTIPAALQAC